MTIGLGGNRGRHQSSAPVMKCTVRSLPSAGIAESLVGRLLLHLLLALRPIRLHVLGARPNAVLGSRQIGNQVATLIIGYNFLDVVRRQLCCFRDYPDACLWSCAAGNHAADIVRVNCDRRPGSSETSIRSTCRTYRTPCTPSHLRTTLVLSCCTAPITRFDFGLAPKSRRVVLA